jgi:hypothetical protein
MFEAWRNQLKAAEQAFQGGRLDEAEVILAEGNLCEHPPARTLSAKVAQGMAQRARRQIANGDTAAGWRDLDRARDLAGDLDEVLTTRGEMVAEALDEIGRCLELGDTSNALLRLEKLHRRNVSGPRVRTLRLVALRLKKATRLRQRGRFSEAFAELESAASIQPEWEYLQEKLRRYQQYTKVAQQLHEQLQLVLVEKKWQRVADIAQQMLHIAPEWLCAKDAKSQAWEASASARAAAPTQYWNSHRSLQLSKVAAATGEPKEIAAVNQKSGQRFVLWIDAVGGYLVCRQNEVVLGQASPGNQVDIPILADISRKHATIRREAEGYLIVPHGLVTVSGRTVEDSMLLRDGDEIGLGESVRLRFRRPHALSASARLEMLSRHKTQPSVDGIILMAESFILGPSMQNHVICRDWDDDVILFQAQEELYARTGNRFDINGTPHEDRGRIDYGSQVSGEDFAFYIEEY